MRVPPTVMLMDALNTNIQNQSEVHRHMVMLLKTLPASTPIAVFMLGHTLHMIQNFTTDPALLRAAVDQDSPRRRISSQTRRTTPTAPRMLRWIKTAATKRRPSRPLRISRR